MEGGILSSLAVPLIFVGLAFAFISIAVYVSRNYKKCPPNEVLIFSGRKYKILNAEGNVVGERGYRMITGGAGFRFPLLEVVDKLSLNTFQVPVRIENTPNADGVLITLEAVANLKVSSDSQILPNAVERHLGEGPDHIRKVAATTLEGILREIAGTLEIEKIIKDRQSISQEVQSTAANELSKLGLRIDNFVITKVSDDQHYIESLGKKKTAEVKRDATIGEAEALRDATIRSSLARRDGEEKRFANETAVVEAEKGLNLRKAAIKKDVETANAEADLARKLKEAEVTRTIRTREVEIEEAEVQARIKVAEQQAIRTEKELVATQIKPAEATRQAAIIQADGAATAEVRRADGDAKAITMRAEAEKTKRIAEGEGVAGADAAMKRQLGLAEADATRAKGEAEGLAIKAKLLAEAEGKLKNLLAEAEGLLKKNEALTTMSPAARTIIILEKLPQIIEEAGEAGERVIGSAFEHVGTGLSRIDSLNIIDMGGGNGGSNPVERFALSVPGIVFKTLQQAKALGIDFDTILEKLGIDAEKLIGMVGESESPAEEAEHS